MLPLKKPPMKSTQRSIQNNTNKFNSERPPMLKRSEVGNRYQSHRDAFKNSKQDFKKKTLEVNNVPPKLPRNSSRGTSNSKKISRLMHYKEYMRDMQGRFQKRKDSHQKLIDKSLRIYRSRVSSAEIQRSNHGHHSKAYDQKPLWWG